MPSRLDFLTGTEQRLRAIIAVVKAAAFVLLLVSFRGPVIAHQGSDPK